MGGLVITTHWQRLVLASVQDFIRQENNLKKAVQGGDANLAKDVSYEVLRTGMVGAIFLYHFAEVALERGALASFNPKVARKSDVHALMSKSSVSANGAPRPDDHKILGEVADAIKHAELNSPNIIYVPRRNRVIEISHDAPLLNEGHQDGTAQVIISTVSGPRSLRAIFENVGRGWTNLLGLDPI